jgi:hypothetical protein
LPGLVPALGLDVFIIVLPVDSTAINGRSADYLDVRSVFLPAHHPGDEGIGARPLALCFVFVEAEADDRPPQLSHDRSGD